MLNLLIITNICCCIELLSIMTLLFSVLAPAHRIWPPSSGFASPQFWLSWFIVVTIIIALLMIACDSYNTWRIFFLARFYIGVPLCITGALITVWALLIAGTKNTLGIQNGLVTKGPYRFSRNPQYLGDILLLMGLAIFINSEHFAVAAMLAVFIFCLMPLPEEDWLRERYGKQYQVYQSNSPRFI